MVTIFQHQLALDQHMLDTHGILKRISKSRFISNSGRVEDNDIGKITMKMKRSVNRMAGRLVAQYSNWLKTTDYLPLIHHPYEAESSIHSKKPRY